MWSNGVIAVNCSSDFKSFIQRVIVLDKTVDFNANRTLQ